MLLLLLNHLSLLHIRLAEFRAPKGSFSPHPARYKIKLFWGLRIPVQKKLLQIPLHSSNQQFLDAFPSRVINTLRTQLTTRQNNTFYRHHIHMNSTPIHMTITKDLIQFQSAEYKPLTSNLTLVKSGHSQHSHCFCPLPDILFSNIYQFLILCPVISHVLFGQLSFMLGHTHLPSYVNMFCDSKDRSTALLDNDKC